MARKLNFLPNDYRLPNRNEPISKEELERLLTDFEFFMSNYQQIVTKGRQTIPFRLNGFQRKLFKTLLPIIHPKTRQNKKQTIVVLKPRQVGASTGVVAFINYVCAFVEGMNHLNILHIFPVGDSVLKFYKEKVNPIISGVHPFIYPNILTDKISSSIISTYRDIRGIRRDNTYEIISSKASSIRSASVHIALFDEAADYQNPEELEDALVPALPKDEFSLVVYLSTFSEKRSDYFTNKVKTALDHPDVYQLLFSPWYESYPQIRTGIDYHTLKLSLYDRDTIIPALEKDGIPEEEWGDLLNWHHEMLIEMRGNLVSMKQEYPTTVGELLAFSESESVFDDQTIEAQEKNITHPTFVRLTNDSLSRKVDIVKTDLSPVKIFSKPSPSKNYMLTVDPIIATGEDTDFFAASMFDRRNHEQVAVIHGRDLPIDDWAILCVNLAQYYNRAIICPESNLAQAFFTVAWGMGYYNWYYTSEKARKERNAGIRTTAVSKTDMIENLSTMLRCDNLILHDEMTIDELRTFKKVKKRRSNSIRMEAAGKNMNGDTAHDDMLTCLWLYAGTLNHYEVAGKKRRGWGII